MYRIQAARRVDTARPVAGLTLAAPLARSVVLAALVALVAASPGAPAASQTTVGARLFKSGPIQITADGAHVWVANAHADAVSRVDASTGAVSTFPLPDPSTSDRPLGLSVAEDGSAVWVAAHDSDRVYVLDGNGALVRTFDLPWGSGPYSVALSRPEAASGAQRWALVTLHRSARLAAIDTSTGAIHLLGPVFGSPHGIAFTEDGTSAWVTHLFVTDEHPVLTRVSFAGAVPRITTRTNAFAATPQKSTQLQAGDAARNIPEGGYVNFRGHPAQVPSSVGRQLLWLPSQYHNMHPDDFTPDSTIQASLRKFDLATRRVLNDDKVVLTAPHVHDPTKGHNNPPWLGYGWNAGISGMVDVAFARLGARLYGLLVAEQSDDVVVLPWDTPPIRSAADAAAPGLPEVLVGGRPMGIAVSPVAATAYVYNDFTFDVSVLDLADPARPSEARRIALPGPRVGDLLSDATRLRGARLFFASTDPRVSANQKVACASCHINGETDGRSWSMHALPAGTGGQAHGPRATLNLLGLGATLLPGGRDPVTGWGLLHISGDRDEVQDFEHTFQGVQMGGTGFLGSGVQPELGAPNAGRDADLDAIAEYLLAVPALARSPFRAADGTLTEAAVRGATMFAGAGSAPADARCATCHIPETAFQDHGFHDIGARRPAEERELNDASRRGSCLWCAGTPSLVGAFAQMHLRGALYWATSFVNLLEDYRDPGRSAPHGRLNGLTGRQLRDLAELVQSIDGDLHGASVRALRDTSPPRIARVSPTSRTRLEVWFNESVDRAGAEDVDAYRLTETATGRAVPVTLAIWDGQNADRVTLVAPMTASASGTAYALEPVGRIRDLADTVTGGAANAIDPADARNRHAFVLGTTLTITLGASGYENLTVPVHDAAGIGPGLSTWGNDRAVLFNNGGNNNPGFVRFGWRTPFVQATGVTDPTAILAAAVGLEVADGDAQAIEVRRVLQAWSDPAGTRDYNQNPTGAPTWRDHAHPDRPWNRPGAAALGSRGDRPADYDGANDQAGETDAVVAVEGIDGPVAVAGARVTDAFQFWFQYPANDYGYALRLTGTPDRLPALSFEGHDAGLRLRGPVLTLTYRLPDASAPAPTATPRDAPGPTPTRGDEPRPTPDDRPTERRAIVGTVFMPVGWRP